MNLNGDMARTVAHYRVADYAREAERLHRISRALKERKALEPQIRTGSALYAWVAALKYVGVVGTRLRARASAVTG